MLKVFETQGCDRQCIDSPVPSLPEPAIKSHYMALTKVPTRIN